MRGKTGNTDKTGKTDMRPNDTREGRHLPSPQDKRKRPFSRAQDTNFWPQRYESVARLSLVLGPDVLGPEVGEQDERDACDVHRKTEGVCDAHE